MAEADSGKEKASNKGLSLPVLVGLVLGAVVIQVGVLFVLFRVFLAPHSSASAPPAEAAQKPAAVSESLPSGVIVPVEDLVVNPRGSSSRYVLVALGLEVADGKQAERLRQELMIPVRDRIMSVVTSYSIEELQGTGIRDSLRVRIRRELAEVLPGIEVRNVYFSKFVIQ